MQFNLKVNQNYEWFYKFVKNLKTLDIQMSPTLTSL